MSVILVEVVGLKDSSCSPFPCDHTRSCGLYDCHPSGKLVPAFETLKAEIGKQYGNSVELNLILLDEGMPDRIKDIISTHYPPIPFILINGNLTPLGRISLPQLQKELERLIS